MSAVSRQRIQGHHMPSGHGVAAALPAGMLVVTLVLVLILILGHFFPAG